MMWLIYLGWVVGSVHDFLTAIVGVGIIGNGIAAIAVGRATMNDCFEEAKKILKYLKVGLKVLILLIIPFILIPSKNFYYMMLGAKYLSDSSLPPKVLKLLEAELDVRLEDLKGEIKDKVNEKIEEL